MSALATDYALIADKKGDMLVMKVVHIATGIVYQTKRCRAINDLHIKSTLRQYRNYLFEEMGIEQVVLDSMIARHGVDPAGKSLKEILDEINKAQDAKKYLPLKR